MTEFLRTDQDLWNEVCKILANSRIVTNIAAVEIIIIYVQENELKIKDRHLEAHRNNKEEEQLPNEVKQWRNSGLSRFVSAISETCGVRRHSVSEVSYFSKRKIRKIVQIQLNFVEIILN